MAERERVEGHATKTKTIVDKEMKITVQYNETVGSNWIDRIEVNAARHGQHSAVLIEKINAINVSISTESLPVRRSK